MNDKVSSQDSNHKAGCLNGVMHSDAIFYLLLAVAIFLSYGYEIFNFNLTIDEEMHAIHSGKWNEWIAQGRWGMALLNYILLPNPITPVVSLSLGLIGTVLGIIFFIKNTFQISRLGVLSIAALAITTPTLAFTFTFSTLAYGVGCAFLALSIGNSLIYKKPWQNIFFACLLAAFAISVYQTFVFVLAMFVLVHVWRCHAEKNSNLLDSYKRISIYFIGSILLYFLINLITLKATSLDIKYIGQFIDFNGFLQNPIQKSIGSADRVMDILSLRPSLFGIRSVWLSAVLLISIIFSIAYPLINKSYDKILHVGAVLVFILMVIVFADAIAQGGAPLRSIIYIPIAIAIIVSVAFTVIGDVGMKIIVALCLLAVIGNSMVNNHLFASSASAEIKDKALAQTIIAEVRRLNFKMTDYTILKIEVIGNKAWPVTGVQSKTETFGASFFEWDGGNRHRVSAYLNLNGLATVGASEAERAGVYEQQKNMPSWPQAGWIALEGDVLVLKLGDYSALQKENLCAQGVVDLCS